MPYITQTDVDTILGAGWEGDGDPERSVQQANDWLTARSVPEKDDERITRAGAYLARMAAQSALYADSDGVVSRSRVKADTVEVEEEYRAGSRAVAGDMAYAMDLLRPYLKPMGSTIILRRL